MKNMTTRQTEWDKSYENRDNFVFYPHEEVIRFVSKFIRKRVGLTEFQDALSGSREGRILDLGCGIGRHVIYCHEMGLDAHGIDLSDKAIQFAVQWAGKTGLIDPESKICQGDIRRMPWQDGYFRYAVSHGVLDSMSFDIARTACAELARVMSVGGLFYCDVISGDDSKHAREFNGEETVTTTHEQGTLQFYFNFAKIQSMIDLFFEIEECNLIRRENVTHGGYTARYHLVLRRL
jgi:SAM-dependent methyltransferase